MQVTTVKAFKRAIWRYYRDHGRHDLAWRKTRDPYRILVSEIMLQQTQVSRVAKFYPVFVRKFPNFCVLARTKTATVLRAWQGMGYNRRALALQKLSRSVLEKCNGTLPRERAALMALPGVGSATAGAIRAFAWSKPEIFIETNIRRVFLHFFFMKRRKVTDGEIERYIKRTLDQKNPREWYYALMDYGAWLGIKSRGAANPNRKSSRYRKQPSFSGSNREMRAKIIKILLLKEETAIGSLAQRMKMSHARAQNVISALVREGFMKKSGAKISILK